MQFGQDRRRVGACQVMGERFDRHPTVLIPPQQQLAQQRLAGKITHWPLEALLRPEGIDEPVGEALAIVQAQVAALHPAAKLQA